MTCECAVCGCYTEEDELDDVEIGLLKLNQASFYGRMNTPIHDADLNKVMNTLHIEPEPAVDIMAETRKMLG